MRLNQTVLFADISRSSRLYETLGDEAAKAIISDCLNLMIDFVERFDGQLIKIIGDEVMATYEQANHAVQSACLMQESVTQYAAKNQLQLGVRIGLNHGPVIHENDDVFGRTVNDAARMVEFAQSGQIITNRVTVKSLPEALQKQTRHLNSLPSSGKMGRMSVYQIIWEQRELTTARTYLAHSAPLTDLLHLKFHDQSIQLSAESNLFSIGRNIDNDLVICDDYTSRLHAQIMHRRGKFILIDKSTNGTFIVFPDQSNAFIHREECVLQNEGWIGLGELRLPNHPDVMYYQVELGVTASPTDGEAS